MALVAKATAMGDGTVQSAALVHRGAQHDGRTVTVWAGEITWDDDDEQLQQIAGDPIYIEASYRRASVVERLFLLVKWYEEMLNRRGMSVLTNAVELLLPSSIRDTGRHRMRRTPSVVKGRPRTAYDKGGGLDLGGQLARRDTASRDWILDSSPLLQYSTVQYCPLSDGTVRSDKVR